jgi:hypothetical protein
MGSVITGPPEANEPKVLLKRTMVPSAAGHPYAPVAVIVMVELIPVQAVTMGLDPAISRR